MNETIRSRETNAAKAEPPVLSRLPLPLQTLCDLVCGAFTRREIVAKIGAATPGYLAVLRALIAHAGARHNRVFPSQKHLAALTGLCHSSVERAVAFFKRAGAIVVLPDFLRRSKDAYPVNGYDLSPLLALLPPALQPCAASGAAFDPAFFSLAVPQNSGAESAPHSCGSEGSVVVVDIKNNTTTNTPSEPHECGTEAGAETESASERSPEEQEAVNHAASLLVGFGVAANLAYELASEHGAARTFAVTKQAEQTRAGVGAGWLVAALRQGWEFPRRGETARYANNNAPFVAPKIAPPPAENTAPQGRETVPQPVTAPASAPDTLEGLTPEQYNALSQEAEAQIRAENPLLGRVGAPRIPRAAVRDRMRKLFVSKQNEAEERAQLDALYAEDDIYMETLPNDSW